MLYLCLLLFYSYVDHLDLHSFPTRRSSDLLILRLVLDAAKRFERRHVAGGLVDAAKQHRHVVELHAGALLDTGYGNLRSEEHTSELQSHSDLVCRLLLEKKNNSRQ